MRERILIIDDNPEICEIVTILLEKEFFVVQSALNGTQGLELVDDDFDLIILDVTLPDILGFDLCKKIRKVTLIPILFLTARTQDTDVEVGFNVGGDDYLSKPFSSIELIARVKALLRRCQLYKEAQDTKDNSNLVQVGDLCIDRSLKEVRKNDLLLKLTSIEYAILICLLDNKSKAISAKSIYEKVWNEPFLEVSNNTVMVHVKNLRKKIETDEKQPKYIRTVWGKGYVIH